jgi:hypothetical protein
MVGRWMILLLCLLAVLLAGCGDGDPDKPLVNLDRVIPSDPTIAALQGDWKGELKQSGVPPFEVAVSFTPGAPTRVAYTGIECGGTWTVTGTLDSLPPYYLFDERIDQGEGDECKGTGSVSLNPEEPCRKPEGEACAVYQHLHYEFRGGGVVSKGVLTRVSETELETVFDEAGIASP